MLKVVDRGVKLLGTHLCARFPTRLRFTNHTAKHPDIGVLLSSSSIVVQEHSSKLSRISNMNDFVPYVKGNRYLGETDSTLIAKNFTQTDFPRFHSIPRVSVYHDIAHIAQSLSIFHFHRSLRWRESERTPV